VHERINAPEVNGLQNFFNGPVDLQTHAAHENLNAQEVNPFQAIFKPPVIHPQPPLDLKHPENKSVNAHGRDEQGDEVAETQVYKGVLIERDNFKKPYLG